MAGGRTLSPPERPAGAGAQALQAPEGARAGASQREIAIALFGRARVEADWRTGDDMRKRVHRLLGTAERLIQTGWRELLRR